VTGAMPIRVMVHDVWDEVRLAVPPSTPVSEVKRRALEATRVRRPPDAYVLKFRGAELTDESASVESAGIVPDAALIVLPRRRRPVR
jgi:hypothetical protein